MKNKLVTDALTACAEINYKLTEYSAIYPITPSSNIGEQYSLKSERGELNIFNNCPTVDILQSEAGAIASCNGALNSGLYSTTFTSSQGLLLMIPNMYKLASSLKPFVLNVASRSVSSHALNIFCDHSDVMSARQTGFTMLFASSVQQAQDFTMLAHMITLKSKIPVMNIFDGFITSHKIDTINALTQENLLNLFPFKDFYEFKNSSLTNINPKILGTNQNPDTFFQNRERISEYNKNLPEIINKCFNDFYKETGRKYSIFEYFGSKNATKIVISIGSSTETLKECLNYLNDDYGVIKVNVFNPFDKEELLKVLPKTCKVITVLDRTKESGSINEPLSLNIKACVDKDIQVLSGRYGLGGKEFDLNCAKAVFENMNSNLKDNFTVGIEDDILNTSLKVEESKFKNDNFKFLQLGVGSDGSVSSVKSSLKIIGNTSNYYVCGNFYYDSKKSGNITQSEMIISNNKIEKNYKENCYNFLVVNNINLFYKIDIINFLDENAILLINTNENLEEKFSNFIKYHIAKKNIKIFTIDASTIAKENGLGNKINNIMQSAFFILTNFIDKNASLQKIKIESKRLYNDNCDYLNNIDSKIKRFLYSDSGWEQLKPSDYDFEKDKNELTVSHFNANGEIVIENKEHKSIFNNIKAYWNENKCIQCTLCEFICPHSAILIKKVEENEIKNAPENFKFIKNKNGEYFCLFVDSNKCTGCGNCVSACPTKALSLIENANENSEYFYSLKGKVEEKIDLKNLGFQENYYNNCTACLGCSEIAYFRLLGKLYGNNLILSNATGCSSIYNGDIDCSPFKKDENNLGTSFISNLFEDNAEFGYGLTKGYNESRKNFIFNVKPTLLSDNFKEEFNKIKNNLNNFEICKNAYINLQKLKPENDYDLNLKNSKFLLPLTHFIVGGDGWSYDIDFGGLEHIVATNKNVNILVLDNEVYSNTGGQTSKATGYGARTKYTLSKNIKKKDLFLSLMQYDNLYFAKVCLGANKNQCVQSFIDAVNHNGPSVIVAYSPCINHKINMGNSVLEQKNAVKSGYFNLMTYKNGYLTLNSTPNFESLDNFILSEGRYKNVLPETLEEIKKQKQKEYDFYVKLQTILNNK